MKNKHFICQDCGNEFESFYCKKTNESYPACPSCQGNHVVRKCFGEKKSNGGQNKY